MAGRVKVCVLGATGFIGGAIARAAVERGWRTRALRRHPGAVGALDDVADQIEWVEGVIEEPDCLAAAMSGCDLVFHAAGYYITRHAPVGRHVVNAVRQTRRVLHAFGRSGAGRLVYTSSLTTIGPPGDPGRLADERDHYLPGGEPASPYYECKYAMESEVLRAAAGGFDVVVANPTMTFGPGDVKAFTGQLVILAAKGRLFFGLPGVLNFADVREVAAGHLAAGEKLRSGERVILGGHNIPVPEAFGIVCAAAGRRPPALTIPRRLVETVGRMLYVLPVFLLEDHMTTLHCWQSLSTSKMEGVLGIRPRPFTQTARDALDWYRRRGYW